MRVSVLRCWLEPNGIDEIYVLPTHLLDVSLPRAGQQTQEVEVSEIVIG